MQVQVVMWIAVSLTLATLSCGNDRTLNPVAAQSALDPVTAQSLLERARDNLESLHYYQIDYHSKSAKFHRGFLEETEIKAIIDFQAPDKKHTSGHISASSLSGVQDSSFEEFWIGQTLYLRHGDRGHWIAAEVSPSIVPEQRNALDVILNDPQLIRELKLATENKDSEKLFRVSLIAEPGVDLGFRESDRTRELIHWISPDDYHIRRIDYSSEGFRPGEETYILRVLSRFDVPIKIIPPDVDPVPFPGQ
jgi:hypothetical protein